MPRSAPHLVLGTAQLGVEYGVANRLGMPDDASARAILEAALQSGIPEIDTARAYGVAEQRVGLALGNAASVKIVTKLAPLDARVQNASQALDAAAASIAQSRQALRRDILDTLLLHRADNRTDWNGAVWRLLLAERDRGTIRNLGVSVQTPQEALSAISDRDVTHIQLPFNALDHRWNEVVPAIRTRRDFVVHVRSVLLQGLLTGESHIRWPDASAPVRDQILSSLQEAAGSLQREGPVDLCIAYARGQDWIDGIVVGIESLEQLERNLALFRKSPLSQDECDRVRASLPRAPNDLLDPARWTFGSGPKRQQG